MKLDTKKIKKITDEELLELYKENLEKLKGMKWKFFLFSFVTI